MQFDVVNEIKKSNQKDYKKTMLYPLHAKMEPNRARMYQATW